MYYKLNCLLTLVIFFIHLKCLQAFNVTFRYNYNLHVEPFNTQIYKRELNQFYDKASFSLKGFEKIASIPINFPIDICLINMENSRYVSALHRERNGTTHFVVLRMVNESYDLIADIATPNAISMDCISFNNRGYVAIALNLTQSVNSAMHASPLYQIAENRLRAVQYFSAPNLISVFLRVNGNDFFLLHTYSNSKRRPNLYCPYFKWSGASFYKIGQIPCSNARQLAPFSIDSESYVAVANYADQSGRTSTYSEIYRLSQEKKKFELFQKIRTNGAVDVKYFNVPYNEARMQHFLVFGNSISTTSTTRREKAKQTDTDLEADSIFYVYDKEKFIPYQKLSLYAVQKFLPVQNLEAEKFILLVACHDQDIKIYNLNDGKFEESKIQFTEGALAKGIANMRIYQERENSYLIIANELMAGNETNIFLPIFKQEEDANVLRQQMIDWANLEKQRLMTINIKDLRERVERKLQSLEQINYRKNMQHIPEAYIQTVTTETLIYPNLRMSAKYWIFLAYINKALDDLENELQLKQMQRFKRDAKHTNYYDNMEYLYETLNYKTLIVNESLKAKRVNKVSAKNPQFKTIKAKKVIVTEKYNNYTRERLNIMPDYVNEENEVLAIKNLQISGKLNEYQWQDLFNHTLKRKGDIQFLKAAIQIENLKTDTIVVNNDKVNEQNLGALIPIDGGKYIINQNVQFASPVYANEVIVSEKLNNLHVFKGQFDVLLKKSNRTQVIEGLKNVTNIKVVQPITIAGKTMDHQLEAITPNKFINEPLVLQGNFIINGNVYIKRQLNTLDIRDLKEKTSLKQTLDKGIRMDESLKDINLKFSQPLKANNSLITFVNGHDLHRLIRLNQNNIQTIEGDKTFNDSLEIKRGFSEVKNLNGVDLDKLEQNAFLKHTNQSIKVPIKVRKITAKSIKSPKILLNNKNLSNYLTSTGNQTILGSLVVDKLKALNLKVEHLNTDHKIFHQHLNDIYQQKSRNSPQDQVFQENRKFHGSIYVQNLILNTTINDKAVEDIENQLLQLEGNIKYVGNFKFNYAMSVTNMTFQGKLNGILAKDFGKCWLQRKAYKQEFTAVQTFANVHAERGIHLHNKLNGFTMEDFHTQTYGINRDEYLGNVHFENPIEITVSLTTQTLNELLIPQDLLLKSNKDSVIMLNSLHINKDLKVEGILKNITSINDINLYELRDLLNNHKHDTLYVENAYFSQAIPLYKTLNNHNIKQTLDTVWLANENVILPHHVEIADAYFEGLLEFEGPINDMNLDYLRKNYFSKTKPQKASIEMVFSEGATCNKKLIVSEMQAFGKLFEPESNTSFEFNEFVKNTLKINDPHIISGNWFFEEANVQGDVNDVLVNQLNLITDVVLNVKPMETYEIKSRKIFKNAEIENLYANNVSVVNKVPIAKWIRDAVYLYENYTIKGITTIESLNVYNNLIALGKLNNITFNENNLLLKEAHQHIPCSMKISSYLPQAKRFLTNNIENLYVDYINQKHMPTFLENLIPKNANAEIKSHLIFTQPVNVEKYEGPEGFLTPNQWTKSDIDIQNRLSSESNTITTEDMLEKLRKNEDRLKNISKYNYYKIANFDIIQTIRAKSAEIFAMSLKFDSLVENILVVLDMEANTTQIYKWFPLEQQYKITDGFEWLPQDKDSLKIIQKRFKLFQQPIDIDDLKAFITGDLKILYQTLEYPHNLSLYYEFPNETCIIYEQILTLTNKDISRYCLNSGYNEIVLKLPEDKQQVQYLKGNLLALLTNNSIFIYNITTYPTQLKQKLSMHQPEEISFGYFNNICYFAVLSKDKTSRLNQNSVAIYRSINFNDFKLFQLLQCPQPCLHIKFSNIEKSNDFLLHIITNSSTSSYMLYQYYGVMGFQNILSDSTLPTNIKDNQIFNLYTTTDQYLMALMDKERVTLMKIILKLVL